MRNNIEQTNGRAGLERCCNSSITWLAGVPGASLFHALFMALLMLASLTGIRGSTVNVNLARDSNNNEASLAGYNVYCGTTTRVYTARVSVSSAVKNATITNLQAGQTYYFVATAINSVGPESDYSAEVVYTTPSAVDLRIRVAFDRRVILTVAGPVGRTYDIQATPDFRMWTTIGNVSLGAEGLLDFIDANAPSFPKRFYCARDTQLRCCELLIKCLPLSSPRAGRIARGRERRVSLGRPSASCGDTLRSWG